MKKLLLTLAAVVGMFAAGSGNAWAITTTETIYSWIGGTTEDGVSEEGGTAVSHASKDGNNAEVNCPTTGGASSTTYYTLCLSGKSANVASEERDASKGTTAHIHITLNSPLKAGDKITVTGFRNKTADSAGSSMYFYFEKDDGTKAAELKDTHTWTNIGSNSDDDDYDDDGETPSTYTFTVPDDAAGVSIIRLSRNSSSTNLFLTKFIITREVSSETSAPTYTLSNLDGTTRTYDLSLTCKTEDATIYYSDDNQSTWKEFTSAITVNPGATIYAKAQAEGLEESSVVTINIPSLSTSELTETTPAGAEATTQVGTSYTIASDLMKGSANGITGVKIKKSGFKIDVNEGYIITGISGYLGGNSNTASLDAITVDNFTENDLSEAVSLPSTKSSSKQSDFATFSVKNLNATTSINFTFSGSATQINAQFTITYKLSETQPELVKTVTFNNEIPFATLYLDKDVVVPSGVTVYTGALSESGNYFNLTQVKTGVIPANTGVILEGTAGASADFYTTTHTNITAVTSVLSGSTEAKSVSDVYVLSYNEGKEDVGFYKFSGTLPANKAYLEVAASSAPAFRFNFGEETDEPGNVTGINAVTIENRADNVIYDLRGRRVQSLDRPGLYIVNGKKVAIQ